MRYIHPPQVVDNPSAPARTPMLTARALLLCTPLLALAACDVFTGSGHPLHVEGTVVSATTNQPVAGATVEIGWGGNIFVSETGSLPPRTTDAQGRFTARIEKMEGYAFPNCAAAGVRVTAPGYLMAEAGLEGPLDDETCTSGHATVTVELTPLQ
jgi:hypothetical protein